MNQPILDQIYLELSNVTDTRNRRELGAARLLRNVYDDLLKYVNKHEAWEELEKPLQALDTACNVLKADD